MRDLNNVTDAIIGAAIEVHHPRNRFAQFQLDEAKRAAYC